MSGVDDVEYANLRDQVRRIEKLLDFGEPGGADVLLKSFLHNAKARLDEITGAEVRTSDEKREQKSREAATIAQLVEREHNLNAAEKEQYAGFLELDYFTKSNFSALDEFYAASWDKLSEEGKSQMSHRVWEGIRQGEYTFSELPENVRKKESERLYAQLNGLEPASPALANIPQHDRADFIREYEAGNNKAVAEVLNRESFSMNVSTTSSKEESLRDSSASSKKELEGPRSDASPELGSKQLKESMFEGFTLAEADEVVKPRAGEYGDGKATGRG